MPNLRRSCCNGSSGFSGFTSHGNGPTILLEKITGNDQDRDKLNHPTADITAHPRVGIRRMKKRGKLFTDIASSMRVRAAILLLSAAIYAEGSTD